MSKTGYMRLALRLARRGYGATSPNPMVGAVLVRAGQIIGRGWHPRAGESHAEIEALRDALRRGKSPKGATLYVTLEPCCTHGRTPPCTDAILAAGIKKVVIGATDPNPHHRGRAFRLLARAGLEVLPGALAEECEHLNEAFNHWIVRGTPLVTVKAAMTLDGKIATATGESKWITGDKARAYGMKLRLGADAILVGINTVLADDPSLTVRTAQGPSSHLRGQKPRRIVLDAHARLPCEARLATDESARLTTVVVNKTVANSRVTALEKQVNVLRAPSRNGKLDLLWLLKRLGSENVTNLLVEGGGEVNASFLLEGLAHRIAFFYAPRILGGRDSRKAVGGDGASRLDEIIDLTGVQWRRLGPDWLLMANVKVK